MDGKDTFAVQFLNFFGFYSSEKTEVILLRGLRSAHALKLAGGTVVIQHDRGLLGRVHRRPFEERFKK